MPSIYSLIPGDCEANPLPDSGIFGAALINLHQETYRKSLVIVTANGMNICPPDATGVVQKLHGSLFAAGDATDLISVRTASIDPDFVSLP